MTGKMTTLVPEVKEIVWDTEIMESLRVAIEAFNAQKQAGLLPVTTGERATHLLNFDPSVEEIAFIPRMSGG